MLGANAIDAVLSISGPARDVAALAETTQTGNMPDGQLTGDAADTTITKVVPVLRKQEGERENDRPAAREAQSRGFPTASIPAVHNNMTVMCTLSDRSDTLVIIQQGSGGTTTSVPIRNISMVQVDSKETGLFRLLVASESSHSRRVVGWLVFRSKGDRQELTKWLRLLKDYRIGAADAVLKHGRDNPPTRIVASITQSAFSRPKPRPGNAALGRQKKSVYPCPLIHC